VELVVLLDGWQCQQLGSSLQPIVCLLLLSNEVFFGKLWLLCFWGQQAVLDC